MEWIEVENPPGKRLPKWIRSAGLSEEGVVFIPGAVGRCQGRCRFFMQRFV